jgi:hypothetical protein
MRLLRELNWDSRNRLRLRWSFESRAFWYVSIEYGNGNSDPVWSIGVEG